MAIKQCAFGSRNGRRNSDFVLLSQGDEQSVLSLKWLTKSDGIIYDVKNTEVKEQLTKRVILSKIVKLYDQSGFIAPVIARAKMLMQTNWIAKLNWDEPVPDSIAKEWHSIWNCIHEYSDVQLQ